MSEYPLYLNEHVAERASEEVKKIIFSMHEKGTLKDTNCHVVILVPSKHFEEGKDIFSQDYQIKPHILYQFSIGKVKEWKHDFRYIAKSKAFKLWENRDRDQSDCMPHLFFKGDTPFWGGVKRKGIVVACSGFKPYFDMMFSGIIADMCIALTYHSWKQDDFECLGRDYL